MTPLQVSLDLDQAPWTDLADVGLHEAVIERIGLLPAGMVSGRSSISTIVRTSSGLLVHAETSLRNFRAAANIILASPHAVREEGQ